MAETRTFFPELVAAVENARSTSRALVLVAQDQPASEFEGHSGLAPTFLAHLIAMRDRAPQTRTQNRCSASEATNSYEHAAPHADDTIEIKES